MHRAQLQTALCHHITGNRRVDAAGQQQSRLAVGADRHAARTRHFACVYICRLVAHLDIDAQLRIMHVRNQIFILVIEIAADFLANLDGIERELLIRALCLNLEALDTLQLIAQIFIDRVPDGIHILLTDCCTANCCNAEYIVHGVQYLIHVHAVCRLYINGRLHDIHAALTDLGYTAAQVGEQAALKAAAVKTLEHDFAEL